MKHFPYHNGEMLAEQLAVSDIPKDFTGWVEWAIPTGLIHEWVDGVTPNHGLPIDYLNTRKNSIFFFASREDSDVIVFPQLVIEYTEP